MTTVGVTQSPAPHLETYDIRFRRLLVAVDFSPQTERVLAVALQIAEMFQSELFLVHAATPTIYGTGAEPVPLGTFGVSFEIAQACMAELLGKEPRLQALRHEEIIAYTDAPDLISQVVTEKNIDLVIAGSHGAHGMERVALGSIADRILRTVRCPVLVIGPRADTERKLFASILLAASLRPGGLRSAQYATSLAEHFHSPLTLAHVVDPKDQLEKALPDDELASELHNLIPSEFNIRAQASARVEHGNTGDRLASLAVCLHPSLIVTGARDERALADHNPFSTLAEVIRRAPCPVLCVRGHFK